MAIGTGGGVRTFKINPYVTTKTVMMMTASTMMMMGELELGGRECSVK